VGGERTSRPEEESAAEAEDDAVLSPSSLPSPGSESPATGMRSSRSRSRPPNGLRLCGDLSSPIALVAAGGGLPRSPAGIDRRADWGDTARLCTDKEGTETFPPFFFLFSNLFSLDFRVALSPAHHSPRVGACNPSILFFNKIFVLHAEPNALVWTT
jgi:hypothetical protein